MKKLLIITALAGLILSSCADKNKTDMSGTNPLLAEFNTPFNVPPFDLIKTEHFLPAFNEAIKEHDAEIEAIINNSEAPSFENTIEALDASGHTLRKVEMVFNNMTQANTNDELQAVATKLAPITTAHENNISLNEGLFKRVKAVYESKDKLELTTEQATLLKETYNDFVRGGANLPEEKKARFREVNEKLALLTLKFDNNLLAETNSFQLIIENEEDLAGLPESVIVGAAEEATNAGMEGKWLFTTQKPSMLPFLTNAQNRELREKLYRGYFMRGNNNNEFDNKAILNEVVNLRLERANILGYTNHAAYVLDNNMAKTPEKVYDLMYKLMNPAVEMAKQEVKDMQAMIDAEGGNFKLESWDWWYYAEKIRKARYDLDDEILRPYFKLENVRDGAFGVAAKLFNIKFVETDGVPKPHEDAQVFEVLDASNNDHIGILYMDWHPRASKQGGAWMDAYVKQFEGVDPVITNVFNFSKPTGDKPALITFDEAATLFHELGHGLHGLLSKCKYHTLSGTSVARDFVELPSQIMENWALEPEVLKTYATHYETGEVIPDELINKIVKSSHFNQGFITTEAAAAAILDMDWHTITEKADFDVLKFEKESMDKAGLIAEIIPRYRSTYFGHIMGGYDAGYYSYSWAAVLDADAFEAFKETSLFDQATAQAFKDNILSKGGSEDPMVLYKKFRGQEPGIDALLKRKGLQ